MRFATILALAVAATAAPLPNAQIGDLLDDLPVVSSIPGVGGIVSSAGNLADNILGALGSLLDIPIGIMGGIADRLDPRERAVVVNALAEVKNVIQPHVSDAAVEKRDPQRSLGGLVGGVVDGISDVFGNIGSSTIDAIGGLLNIPRDIVGGILDRLDPRDYKRVQEALGSIKVVFKEHME